ncbi:MAG: DUF4328 domain-containing protein [Asticcacaulis sp.]
MSWLVGIFVSVAMMIASGVVSLCWVYGACRNAHVLRPGGVTSFAGLGRRRFFVPVVSLWKPYQTLNDIWNASLGPVNGAYPKSTPLITTWWIGFIAGNLILRFTGNTSGGEDGLTYQPTLSNWADVGGLVLIIAATICFFRDRPHRRPASTGFSIPVAETF